MKKLAFLLTLVMLLGLFAGCHSSEPTPQPATQPTEAPKDEIINCPAPISKSLRDQLDADFLKLDEEYVPNWYDTEKRSGYCRIYGTDNGYTLFYYDGGMRLLDGGPLVVGDIAFGAGATPRIYAYKDGTFITLADAYAQGLVSREALVNAQAYHNQDLELTSREQMITNCRPGAMSRYAQANIEQAWKDLGNETFGTWYTTGDPDADWRYYNGGPYTGDSGVLMYFGGEQEQTFTTVQFGDVTFSHPTGFRMYIYLGSMGLIDLMEAEDSSTYSSMLEAAAQQHIECNNAVYGEGWDQ